MKKALFLLLLTILVGTVPAMANSLFNWTVTGTDIAGSGTLTATLLSPDVYEVTSMTGTFDDSLNHIVGAVTDPFPVTGSQETSPDGKYYYDQLLFLSPSGQLLDSASGLLFNVVGTSALNGGEVNIAGGGTSPAPNDYQLWETTRTATYLPSSGQGYASDFSITQQTPEPGTLSMIGFGLLGLGAFRLRRKTKT